MKLCWIVLHLLIASCVLSQAQSGSLPNPRVSSLTLGSEPVTVVHLRPGYVSAIRLPEEVSSVVIGDPKGFTVEHSEAEPRLVFLKPVSLKASETNVLITTKSGHEIPLHLISDGKSQGGQVDFFLDYERPRSLLVASAAPNFIVGETKTVAGDISPPPTPAPKETTQTELLKQIQTPSPNWEGKQLQVAIGRITENGQHMVVAFSVFNNTDSAVELLPPQVQLSGPSKQRHGGKTKADPVPIDDFTLTFRRLGPRQRAVGILAFERPAFKESDEKLLLQIAQAEQVDRPVLVPISFTAPLEGRGQ
jgi:hypothetical protein